MCILELNVSSASSRGKSFRRVGYRPLGVSPTGFTMLQRSITHCTGPTQYCSHHNKQVADDSHIKDREGQRVQRDFCEKANISPSSTTRYRPH